MSREVNILLVEDEELDFIEIKRLLDKLPIPLKLHRARNGEEAIAMLNGEGSLAKGQLPDVVFLDLNMPRMNGFELLTTITASHKWGELAVYVITTSSDPVDKSAAKALNVKGYIEKPLRSNDLHNQAVISSMIGYLTEINQNKS